MKNRVCEICGHEYFQYDLHTCNMDILTYGDVQLDDQDDLPLSIFNSLEKCQNNVL